MAEDGACVSCKEGSGDPGCSIRVCAKDKGVDMCAFCTDYPCEKIAAFFERNPALVRDNAILLEKGWDAWLVLQDKRKATGYVFQYDEKNEP